MPDGNLNIDDLLTRLTGFLDSPDQKMPLPRVIIDRLEVKDFRLSEAGRELPLMTLPHLTMQGIQASLHHRQLTIDRIDTAGGRIVTGLAADGSFKATGLLLSDLLHSSRVLFFASADNTSPKATARVPWQATIGQIHVTDGEALMEDQTLVPPACFTADNLSVSVSHLSTHAQAKADIDITLRINQAGTLNMKGAATLEPLAADVNVTADKIALSPFQPYVDTVLSADVTAGTASADGRILYQRNSGQSQIHYQGNLQVDWISARDRIHREDFIDLAQLKASGIGLDLGPNRLHVADVWVDRPQARVTIDADGTINVLQTLSVAEPRKYKKVPNLLQRLTDFLMAEFKGPISVDIERVRINAFSGDFVDQTVSPAYVTHMQIPHGEVIGMSSDPSHLAEFKIQGRIDPSATISVTGRSNPMKALKQTEVDIVINNFVLPSVSSYSGKFVGYGIASGDLSLALTYRIENDRFKGDNKIVTDGLTLGDRVDSPHALHLPVALAVSLLKDDQDRIALQVPVKGDLKDPHFSFTQAIKAAITGMLDDIGKSPFAAIKDIGGFKGEELRFIAFEFGHAELNPRESQKLDALARFLNTKTSLMLGIEGHADRRMDGVGPDGQKSPTSVIQG